MPDRPLHKSRMGIGFDIVESHDEKGLRIREWEIKP